MKSDPKADPPWFQGPAPQPSVSGEMGRNVNYEFDLKYPPLWCGTSKQDLPSRVWRPQLREPAIGLEPMTC